MNSSNSAILSFGEILAYHADTSERQITSITCENFRTISPRDLKRQGVSTIVVPSEFRPLVDDQALIRCRAAGIRVLNEIEFREISNKAIDIDRLSNGWLAYGDTLGGGVMRRIFERILDVSLSLAILVLTAPVLLITALLIKLDSPGPIFYRQTRVGLFGAPFEIIKFRSMRADAEVGGAPVWASARDPRVTRVGAVIRLLRIDELPQLLNVLKGEMSVIGPRPERPHFVDNLAEQIPHYRDRSVAKPGITGWAQVNYPYGASVEDARRKLSYDLYYIKHRSFMLDIRICVATVRVIIFREGAR
ncbi:exopolysaccharide biosynthesis polyprenyl glycosylphosphotransferase [Acidiphilium sp.]|uniref:exopolysaccharide biosynthesis polyprenyl glycosylphosphotransferase n=1 Tax=Acidiphilium sp. TaxID=527 RepID=UPI003CFD5809